MRVFSALSAVNRATYLLSAVTMFGLAWIILFDVIGRGFFNHPLTGTFEIVSNTIVVIAFFQLAYSIQIGGMIKSDILISRLPARGAAAARIFRHLCGALVFGLGAYASFEPMLDAWASGEYAGAASFRYPTYPVRSIIVITCTLAALVYVSLAWRLLIGSPLPEEEGEA
jgi:TRAP-type C4-dicarboxylate transport system permease small subunit